MSVPLKYVGATKRYFDVVDGSREQWTPGRVSDVADATAVALIQTGFFAAVAGAERLYTAAQLAALSAAGGLTPYAQYVDQYGVVHRAISASEFSADATLPALSDSSGRTVLSSASAVAVATAASALGVSRSPTPAYYRSAQGVTARLPSGLVGVGYSGKIVVIDSSGNVWRYTEAGDGWTVVAATLFASQVAGINFLFADSRGYLFFASSVAGYNVVYRSTDDGANWTTVLTLPGASDSGAPIAEDDQGNLHVTAYGGGTVGNYCVAFSNATGGINAITTGTISDGTNAATLTGSKVVYTSATTGYFIFSAAPSPGNFGGAAACTNAASGQTCTVAGPATVLTTSNAASLAFNSRSYHKSTDGGATWTNLTANLPATVQRHIHGCWWDDYRKLLFITHGDNGASSQTFVSGDRGATFSIWAASGQATGMAFSPDYVFYASDNATDRGVYRVSAPAGTTAAALAASTPTRVFDWRADGGQAASGGASGSGNGYAWWGGYDNGVVFFPFGSEGLRAVLLTSYDQGSTWAEADAVEAAGSLYHEQACVSQFNTGRDGWYYGRNSNQTLLNRWGVFAPGTVAQINAASTSSGTGVRAARGELIGYGLRSPGLIQKLTAPYASPIMLSAYGVLLANGQQAGVQGAGALVFHNADDVTAPSMTFSPNPITLSTSGTGSAVVTSTTQKYSGANSFKAACSAGTGASQFRLTTAPWGTADGTEAWVSMRVYWNGTIDANRQDIIEFNSIRVGTYLVSSKKILRVFQTTLATTLNTQDSNDLVEIPENTWFRLKFACSLSPNSAGGRRGRVRVWVDVGAGWRSVCDAIGVPTYSSVSANLFLGINQPSGASAANCYLDDIRWGTSDPDRMPALTLAQSPAAVPDLGFFA